VYYVNIINPPDEQKEGLLPFPKRGSDQFTMFAVDQKIEIVRVAI